MNVKQTLSKYLTHILPKMHKIRRLSIYAAIESTLNRGALSVTGLGRNLDNKALEKHRIKRVESLCSNVHLQKEISSVYRRMCAALIQTTKRPIIQFDWSDMGDRKQDFVIQALFSTQGRSLTLYEQTH